MRLLQDMSMPCAGLGVLLYGVMRTQWMGHCALLLLCSQGSPDELIQTLHANGCPCPFCSHSPGGRRRRIKSGAAQCGGIHSWVDSLDSLNLIDSYLEKKRGSTQTAGTCAVERTYAWECSYFQPLYRYFVFSGIF